MLFHKKPLSFFLLIFIWIGTPEIISIDLRILPKNLHFHMEGKK